MRFKKSNFVLSLLPVAATALPLVLASPAYAGGYYVGNGGQGGNADDAGMVNFGGIGGDGILGYDGGAGSGSGAESGTGGGGGGSGGGDGGAGGQGDGAAAPAGGAGGAMAGDNGDAGADALVDTSSGGGGGGGGAHGEIATDDVSYSGLTLLFGGVGGAGGVGGTPAGPDGGGGGGAGGAGGAGLFVQFNDVVVTNDGYIGGGRAASVSMFWAAVSPLSTAAQSRAAPAADMAPPLISTPGGPVKRAMPSMAKISTSSIPARS